MVKTARVYALIILVLSCILGFAVVQSEINPDSKYGQIPFKYGLDLSGGSQLLYQADVSKIPEGEVEEAMRSLRDVIERRLNAFGVSEVRVQTERGGVSGQDERLMIEMPGITDVNEAIAMIGETPELEFMLLRPGTGEPDEDGQVSITLDYESTGITGALVRKAVVFFDQGQGGLGISEPVVQLDFNEEGKELFAEVTRDNVGQPLAIFLDGEVISSPNINEEIPGGTAIISGNFEIDEAKQLVRDLNLGALPVPIEIASTNTIGPTLGAQAVSAGAFAGMVGVLLVMVFMIFWYRLAGVVAAFSLLMYVLFMLTLFKLLPVTLTAAGIAGFILSIGMAVDANVLIFERIGEEIRIGKGMREAINDGFNRAWVSIRDANLSSLITAIILFWFGTSIVKGFALTFGFGVLISMLTAVTVSHTFMHAIVRDDLKNFEKYFKVGYFNRKKNNA